MVDYSKAFDVINHPILLRELGVLGLKCAYIFMDKRIFWPEGHKLLNVILFTSKFKQISRSIVQGSVLGPTLYIALARKLKTLSTKK